MKRQRASCRAAVAAATVLTIVQFSCGIFETREPESPSQSSSNYVPPTDPSLVFQNMTNAVHDLNSLNYLRSFADSATAGRGFRFEPTPQATSRYGGIFLSWSKQSEQQYFENMKAKMVSGGGATLEFLTLTEQSRQADSSQVDATYRLTVQHSLANVAKQVRGRSQFFLITDHSGNWTIWRWIDLALSQSDSTWSDIKGAFGQ